MGRDARGSAASASGADSAVVPNTSSLWRAPTGVLLRRHPGTLEKAAPDGPMQKPRRLSRRYPRRDKSRTRPCGGAFPPHRQFRDSCAGARSRRVTTAGWLTQPHPLVANALVRRARARRSMRPRGGCPRLFRGQGEAVASAPPPARALGRRTEGFVSVEEWPCACREPLVRHRVGHPDRPTRRCGRTRAGDEQRRSSPVPWPVVARDRFAPEPLRQLSL